MAAHGEPLTPKKRLDSWKEIASFFGRDERTVKRWEKERGLPVYRVPGSARGGVFAYAEELAEWLKTPSHDSGETPAAKPVASEVQPPPRLESSATAEPLPVPVVVQFPATSGEVSKFRRADETGPRLAPAPAIPSRVAAAKSFVWLLPLALIALFFLVFSFGHRETRFKNALAAPHISNPEAQDLYLKGRYYFEKRTPDDLNKAVDFFTQAIVHDPGYPAPYVGLADTYNLLREYSAMPSQEAFPRARAAATKAVELDPSSAEGHNSLAFATFWGFFDAATADREFRRAIELDPSLARAHHWYATFLIEIGRNQQALAEIERARQLDPSSTPILADKGLILSQSGKKDEARALLTQLAASQPDFVHAHEYLSRIYFGEGDYAGYFDEQTTVARLRRDPSAEKAVAAEEIGYSRAGLQGLLEARLASAENQFQHASGPAFNVAQADAALGRTEEAMKYLRIAYQRRELDICTLPVNSSFQSMRQNPDFRELLAKAGLSNLP